MINECGGKEYLGLAGSWINLLNVELNCLYCSPNVINDDEMKDKLGGV